MRRMLIASGFLAALVTGCGSDSTGNTPAPPEHDILIVKDASQKGNQAFAPDTLTHSLADGSSITWYNGDIIGSGGYGGTTGTTHRLVADDGTTFVGDFVVAGGSQVITLNPVADTIPYHCSIHPTMKGTLIITP